MPVGNIYLGRRFTLYEKYCGIDYINYLIHVAISNYPRPISIQDMYNDLFGDLP
jgi:hypothetical protein